MYVLKTILNTNKQNVLDSYYTINDAVKHILESNNIDMFSIKVVSTSPSKHIYHIKNKDLTYCIEYKED